MPYQFPPDIEERVKARMVSGAFHSEDDVLREAMDALDQIEQDKLIRWHERNQTSMEQSRLGLSKELDLEALLARVEDRVTKLSQGR
jgi:Arc/MetJ-type ribon-helix-helix transcriptional regulator